MLTETACRIINENVVFFPGWKIYAEDFTSRHEGCVCLYIEAPSVETNRPEAMEGYCVRNTPRATTMLQVADLADDVALHRAVIEKLIEFWTHEARECYRVKPSYWAPFHPHQIDGMKRWGTPDKDITYGFNAMSWKEAPTLAAA